MKLVIAEKPSVAQSLAKVIGANSKKDGYLEGNGYIVSWCVGHLIELARPESYDEKKLCAYQRTDSRYLTDDMEDSSANLCCLMKDKYGYTKMVPINARQVLNSSKVSDYHAIIPKVNVSEADYSKIPSGEQKILGLITARLLSAVGDSAEITEYALEVEYVGHTFKAKSKCITKPGWHLLEDWILGKKTDEDEDYSGKKDEEGSHSILEILEADSSLLEEGRELPARDPKVKEGKTTPKKRFTDVRECRREVWNTP